MGKVSFCDLQDKSGRIQLYARRDEMDPEAYNRFKKYDIAWKGSRPSSCRALSFSRRMRRISLRTEDRKDR